MTARKKTTQVTKSLGAAALALAALSSLPAQADPIADFYRGKNFTIIVGYSAGGGYDVYARAIARYINRQIPGNPNVIVTTMPGAGFNVVPSTPCRAN